jgi:hypothetical protein
VKGRTITKRRPVGAGTPKTMRGTTKTADGGQLYVRGGTGGKTPYRVPDKAMSSYMDSAGTKNPKIARGLTEATYLAMNPTDKRTAKLAKGMGDLAEKRTSTANKAAQARGDKTRR